MPGACDVQRRRFCCIRRAWRAGFHFPMPERTSPVARPTPPCEPSSVSAAQSRPSTLRRPTDGNHHSGEQRTLGELAADGTLLIRYPAFQPKPAFDAIHALNIRCRPKGGVTATAEAHSMGIISWIVRGLIAGSECNAGPEPQPVGALVGGFLFDLFGHRG